MHTHTHTIPHKNPHERRTISTDCKSLRCRVTPGIILVRHEFSRSCSRRGASAPLPGGPGAEAPLITASWTRSNIEEGPTREGYAPRLHRICTLRVGKVADRFSWNVSRRLSCFVMVGVVRSCGSLSFCRLERFLCEVSIGMYDWCGNWWNFQTIVGKID